MHKRDAGVLSDLYVASGCSLEPSFAPMVVNYRASCGGVAVGTAEFKSKNDMLVNDVQFVESKDGLATIPVELYHETPTVLMVQTLRDIEDVEEDG
ncbi:unnamed protein product, partial [Amoebophrya sp. A25]|eukprot:GSA25T00017467001.1